MNKTWFQSIFYWKLAFFECITDTLTSIAMVWLAAVAQSDWSQLSHTAKCVIYVSMGVQGLKTIKTYLTTTISVLQDNMPLAPGVTQRQEVKETTKTVVESPPAPAIVPPVVQPIPTEPPKQP